MSRRQSARPPSQCEALEPRVLLSIYTINGTAGDDTIVLFTFTHFVPPGIVEHDVRWTLNGVTSGQQVMLGTDSIVLDTGTGSDTVTVSSTFPGVPTTIQGSGGGDVLTVGDSSGMQDIRGDVTVEPGWNVTLNDAGDAGPRNASISEELEALFGAAVILDVTGLAPGEVMAESLVGLGASTSNVTIQAGSGADTFNISALSNVTASVSMPFLSLNTGSGADTVNITGAVVPLIINDQASVDEINVFYGGGSVLGSITVNGGGASDVAVVGGSPADQFTVASNAIAHGTQTLDYSGIQSLALELGTFNVSNDLGGMNLSAQGVGTFVNLQGTEHLSSLDIEGGARVNVAAAGATWGNTVFCTELSIAGTGKLDLSNNQLYLSYTADPIAAIRSYLHSGYNAGAWSGPGIISSSADAHHGLGLADSADGTAPASTVPSNELLVRWTRFGDSNLDGIVNFSDVLILIQHYGRSGQNWDEGDTNYDGATNFSDVLALIQNYAGAASVAQPLGSISSSLLSPIEDASPRRRRQSLAALYQK